jgi:hypothetical protein
MKQTELADFVHRSELIYEARLQSILEPQHTDQFVAIEPESGDYFLGRTLNDAAKAARSVYPQRLTHIMRVGHRAAIHLGCQT